MADLLQKVDLRLHPRRVRFQHITCRNPKVKKSGSYHNVLQACKLTKPPAAGCFEFLIHNLNGRAARLRGLGRPVGRPYQQTDPPPKLCKDVWKHQTPVKKVPASNEAGTVKPIKLHNYSIGFTNWKKPVPLDGSMGVVMNTECLPLTVYVVGPVAVD